MKATALTMTFVVPEQKEPWTPDYGPKIFPATLMIKVDAQEGVFHVRVDGLKVKADGTPSRVLSSTEYRSWKRENWPPVVADRVALVEKILRDHAS